MPKNIVVISVDPILIEQVILNLLENAVYHATGMTTLSLKAVTLVADNGCVIDESRLKTLFSGYYEEQQDMAHTSHRNVGIGLSVCSTIIKAHGGRIVAENRKGGGALIRFTIRKEINDDEKQ